MKKSALALALILALTMTGCNNSGNENEPFEAPATEITAEETPAAEVTTTAETENPDSKPEFSGKCGENLTWEFTSPTLTIKGTGEMKDFETLGNGNPSCPWYYINMSRVIIEEGCTSIGDMAFCNCKDIGYIELPSTITEIGREAFKDCENLGALNCPDSLVSIGEFAFYGCKSLEEVTLGNSLKKISKSAFAGCRSLTSIEIPDSVTEIGDYAFGTCYELSSVKMSENISSYGEGVFNSCDKLAPVFVKGKGEASGKCGENLTYKYKDGTLTISGTGDMYDNIDYNLDYNNEGMSSVYDDMHGLIINDVIIEEGCTSVGGYSFYGCDTLKSVTLPNSINIIRAGAFGNCRGLESINIPDSVTEIEFDAFNRCSSLEDLVIPDTTKLPYYDSQHSFAFYKVKHITYHGPSVDGDNLHWGAESIN